MKEAIVNAVCHRAYKSNGSAQGLTIQKLHGPHKSLPANPLLADPMYWNGYIEKIGSRTEDIINKCCEYGLKSPEFYQDEDFKVIIWRTNKEGSDPERSRKK